ncbi:hypothetical protein EW145_g8166 [Phellinidium pouzarii]|uniref:Retroviral polymerase SH3-like domain-containing protein n=1 Tax=Phellinidium pouzarii TaxID=167371 RepID=A0A4S4KD72_9AGAM|nr:hypothetical protein EW145_g8166 [Phellinidium pouzarii]
MCADHADIPDSLWPELYAHANYLRNLSPSSRLKGLTPFEAYYGKKPNVSNLRPFWASLYIHVPDQQRLKLDPRAKPAKFIGFETGTKGYKYYIPSTGVINISRDVIFPDDITGSDKEDIPTGGSPAPSIEGGILSDSDSDSSGDKQPINNTSSGNLPPEIPVMI